MSRIHTIEMDFSYQMKELINDIKNNLIDCEVLEEGQELTGNMLWENKELLGELLFTRIEEQIGFEEVGVVDEIEEW